MSDNAIGLSNDAQARLTLMTKAAYRRFRQMGLARGWMPVPAWDELPDTMQDDWREIAAAADWAGVCAKAASEETLHLRGAIDALCSARGIDQVDGPPMAVFDTRFDEGNVVTDLWWGAEARWRYDYRLYSWGVPGSRQPEHEFPACVSLSELRGKVLSALQDDLKSNQVLVWRVRPQVTVGEARLFHARFRCVQMVNGETADQIIYPQDIGDDRTDLELANRHDVMPVISSLHGQIHK